MSFCSCITKLGEYEKLVMWIVFIFFIDLPKQRVVPGCPRCDSAPTWSLIKMAQKSCGKKQWWRWELCYREINPLHFSAMWHILRVILAKLKLASLHDDLIVHQRSRTNMFTMKERSELKRRLWRDVENESMLIIRKTTAEKRKRSINKVMRQCEEEWQGWVDSIR